MPTSKPRSSVSVFAIVALCSAFAGILMYFLPFFSITTFFGSSSLVTGIACVQSAPDGAMNTSLVYLLYGMICNILIIPFAAIAIKKRSLSIPAMALSLVSFILTLLAVSFLLSDGIYDIYYVDSALIYSGIYNIIPGIGFYLLEGLMLVSAVLSILSLAKKPAAAPAATSVSTTPVDMTPNFTMNTMFDTNMSAPAMPNSPAPAAERKADTFACPNCGATNALSNRFCLKCGNSLASAVPKAKFCRTCGKPLAETNLFCSGCGTPVASPATPTPIVAVPPAVSADLREEPASDAAVRLTPAPVPPVTAPAVPVAPPAAPVAPPAAPVVPPVAPVVSPAAPAPQAPRPVAPAAPVPPPAAAPANPGYTPPSVPKEQRRAICPNCGARQLPARYCKYCGSPM